MTFSQPVSAYVQNFLGFPAGTRVPLATYEPGLIAWAPKPDGRVIAVLAVNNGVASIDADGDGAPDTPAQLAANGFSTGELQQLAVSYQPGATLMRTRLFGLYPFDANLPFRALGVDPVVVAAPGCASATRDIVKCDVRNATQSVAVPGTPLSLAYTSARSTAAADRTLDIPITGNAMPADLMGMYVHVTVAGQTTEMQYLPAANVTYHYVWDGNDAYGRPVQGNPPAVVEIGHLFPAEYQYPAEVARSFGLTCSAPPANGTQGCRMPQGTSAEFSERHSVWRVSTAITKLGGLDAKAQGLGGFDFNVHHQYDPAGRVLYLGDGTTRVADAITPVITTIAGAGQADYPSGDGGPAIKAKLAYQALHGMAALPDGRVLVPNAGYLRIVGTDGIISRFAGWARSTTNFSYGYDLVWQADGSVLGENGLKDSTYLEDPQRPSIGADGTIYLADNFFTGRRLLKIRPDGLMLRVAGNRSGVPIREGVQARDGVITGIVALAVGANNTLYLTDAGEPSRVYSLGADSVYHLVAGTGAYGDPGEGRQATQTTLTTVNDLAVGPDGSVYIALGDVYNWQQRRVSKVTPDGVIRTFVGGGNGAQPDKTNDRLNMGFSESPTALAVSPENLVYVNDGQWVMSAAQDGTLRLVAGSGVYASGLVGDGGPALRSKLNGVSGLAIAPDGGLLIADFWNGRVRKVAASMPGFTGGAFIVASADGSELYSFDATGKHLKTVDALTHKTIYEFGYDAIGRAAALTDANGQVTRIERGDDGLVQAIIAPGGQRTTFRLDSNGNAVQIARLGGDSATFVFGSDGIMRESHGSSGQLLGSAAFDSDGKLLAWSSQGAAAVAYAPSAVDNGSAISLADVTGGFASIVYRQLPLGTRETRIEVFPGVAIVQSTGSDGERITRYPNGTTETVTQVADARYGMEAPLTTTVVRLPSGLAKTMQTRRGVAGGDLSNPFDTFSSTDSSITNGRVTISRTDPFEGTMDLLGPGGKQAHIGMDDSGRPVEISVPGRASMRTSIDERGQLVSMSIGERRSSVTFGAPDRVATRTDPMGNVERFGYDAAGRLTLRQLPGGRSLSYAYDPAGHLASVTPNGRPATRLTWDVAGRLTQYHPFASGDSSGIVVTGYDSLGRETTFRHADGRGRTLAYQASSPDVVSTSTDGDTIRYVHAPSTAALSTVFFNRGPAVSYTYDGHLITGLSWTGLVSGQTSYSYNNDLKIVEEKVNGANAVAVSYDGDGQIAVVGSLALTRDAATGDVTMMDVGAARTMLRHSQYAELEGMSTTVVGIPTYSTHLTRDKLGRITTKADTLLGSTAFYEFGYDTAGQVVDVKRNGEAIEHYDYDQQGNRVREVSRNGVIMAQYDDHDRLLAYGIARFSYDATGATTLRVVAGDTTRFEYSVWGQLRGVRLPNGTLMSYVYDGKGRRVGKTENGVLVRQWLYRGTKAVVAELDGQNNLLARFVYGVDATPEYMIKGGSTYRFLKDERQSVRAIVDVATGSIAQIISYDAFGRVLSDSNPDFQPFAYAGGLYDAVTGLVHFDAREYDASTGRWLTPDPQSFDGGDANIYRYATADPINVVDRRGTAPFTLQDRAEATYVDGQVDAMAATSDAAALEALRVARRQIVRREMCSWAANEMSTYSEWLVRTDKDGFQGHHPARSADLIDLLGKKVYKKYQAIIVPIFGNNTKGTPHYDAGIAQRDARALGYGVVASAIFGLEAAGCSAEDIVKIMNAFFEIADQQDWLLDDDPR